MGGKATEPDDSFLREWTIPEEDRHKYTSQPWAGEYRWFRSSNVVCLDNTDDVASERRQANSSGSCATRGHQLSATVRYGSVLKFHNEGCGGNF